MAIKVSKKQLLIIDNKIFSINSTISELKYNKMIAGKLGFTLSVEHSRSIIEMLGNFRDWLEEFRTVLIDND